MSILQCNLLYATVLCFCVSQCSAISCYVCNSHNNNTCTSDNIPENFKIPCQDTSTMCRKIKQVIDFDVNGLKAETRIIRSCGTFNKTLGNHCYQRSGFGGRQEVCSCNDKNFCNSSDTLLPSVFLIISFLASKNFYIVGI